MCTYVCIYIHPLPEVRRRGVPVDLIRHKEGAHYDRAVISQGQRQSNSYKAIAAGRLQNSASIIMTTVPGQVQANSSGDSGYRYAHAGPGKLPVG